MAAFTRSVHPATQVEWGPLARFAPDVHYDTDVQPMGLAFIDPDGEAHIYVFDENGRQALLQQLTGGIILANGNGGVH